MAKHDPKGRSKGEKRHIRLYHDFTDCPAWRDLSGNAIKLLVALMRLDKGGDNGALFMSVRDAAAAIGVTTNTASKLFRELEEHGFISATQRGHFKVKTRLATTWRLTWIGAPGRTPSRDFDRWQPPADGNKSRSQKLRATVPIITSVAGNEPTTVPIITTVPTETSQVSNPPTVSKTGTQVVCHRQGAEPVEFPPRKQANSAGGVSNGVVSDDLLAAVRDQVHQHLANAGVGAQTRLAEAAGIPGGTLSKFVGGRGLGQGHFVKLQLELNRNRKAAA